jgi:hypothetical protein
MSWGVQAGLLVAARREAVPSSHVSYHEPRHVNVGCSVHLGNIPGSSAIDRHASYNTIGTSIICVLSVASLGDSEPVRLTINMLKRCCMLRDGP